jgi:hypothetical protein
MNAKIENQEMSNWKFVLIRGKVLKSLDVGTSLNGKGNKVMSQHPIMEKLAAR